MSKKDPHPDCDIDGLMAKTSINIEKFGLQVIMVPGSVYLPSFAYSIGLVQTYNHPEIICFGLKTDLLHVLINDVAAIIKQGKRIEVGRPYSSVFKTLDAEFLPVDPSNIGDYFKVAIRYYKTDQFPAMQLVWPDQENRFPWQTNFQEKFLHKQPLLDRNAGFKFREVKNLAVFTTRQWLDLKKPILRVVHDNDGEWQFLTGDQFPEDIRLVSLEQMIQRDITLNEVFNLDYGEAADRLHIGGEWTRGKEEAIDDEGINSSTN
jgi:Domain of unknown function (DUF4262)